ncbi:MAG: nucleotide pyrophosphohydrolase [Firmicutes bacterium]|nr:nucleotide pyrophosphohydrolase [Bacillota bacterium]
MDLGALQRGIDAAVTATADGYWPPLANLARLTEEVGELARAVNQAAGPKHPKPGEAVAEVEAEMGDVLFTLALLANQMGVELAAAADGALRRFRERAAPPAQG